MTKDTLFTSGLGNTCATLLLFLHSLAYLRRRRAVSAAAERAPTHFKVNGVVRERILPFVDRPNKREEITQIKFKGSPWWCMIQGENVKDDESLQGKEFRSEFRVPFPIFLYLVSLCERMEWIRKFTMECDRQKYNILF